MAKSDINTLLGDTVDEVKAMGKQGMAHPSTKPVLTGGAIGAAAGFILPVISWPIGLLAGAGIVLYNRVRR